MLKNPQIDLNMCVKFERKRKKKNGAKRRLLEHKNLTTRNDVQSSCLDLAVAKNFN